MMNVRCAVLTLWVFTYALQANAMTRKLTPPKPTPTATSASAPIFQMSSTVHSSTLQASSNSPQTQNFATPPSTCPASKNCNPSSLEVLSSPPGCACSCPASVIAAKGPCTTPGTFFDNTLSSPTYCSCIARSCSGTSAPTTGTWNDGTGAPCCGSGTGAANGACLATCSGTAGPPRTSGTWSDHSGACCGAGIAPGATSGACVCTNTCPSANFTLSSYATGCTCNCALSASSCTAGQKLDTTSCACVPAPGCSAVPTTTYELE